METDREWRRKRSQKPNARQNAHPGKKKGKSKGEETCGRPTKAGGGEALAAVRLPDRSTLGFAVFLHGDDAQREKGEGEIERGRGGVFTREERVVSLVHFRPVQFFPIRASGDGATCGDMEGEVSGESPEEAVSGSRAASGSFVFPKESRGPTEDRSVSLLPVIEQGTRRTQTRSPPLFIILSNIII